MSSKSKSRRSAGAARKRKIVLHWVADISPNSGFNSKKSMQGPLQRTVLRSLMCQWYMFKADLQQPTVRMSMTGQLFMLHHYWGREPLTSDPVAAQTPGNFINHISLSP